MAWWPGSSRKTNAKASHTNTVELYSTAPAVPAAAPAVAAHAAGCTVSAEDTNFSAIIHMLCRGTNPEKAGRAFEDDDEDAVPRSEGKDKVESVSLEDMMGNALQAARQAMHAQSGSQVQSCQEGEG